MSVVTPLINLKPTNPTQEEFQLIQKFGLQPYDRSPNDYLRFVAKIFTAWRDPDDKILNFDPYDDTYGATDNSTTTILQATSDKSIVAYVDGFQINYYFTRLTTDAESTDLTSADNIIETNSTVTYTNEVGEIITINKAKYGEYHRFVIKAGICFIDNQLVQITEDVEWWFRIPDITTDLATGEDIYDADGNPTFELGQFIVDQTKVYSLLPNKRYRIILSYEYINQFESNSARIQFVTAETAVDEPYLLLGTFTTNQFGMVHQTLPVNESNKEIFLNYISKPDPDDATKELYYLRDIDEQYLDKKYMANHKNLFKHLRSQLLTILSESKISNTFHMRVITEEIDQSVSSGDFVYYNAVKNRWYPAVVSRQDFDKVHGLYLKNMSEGTNVLFTSGIIEIDSTYKIVNADNMVLRNLIPGAEYFLVDDQVLIEDNAPFISPFEFTINEDYFTITTNVVAKASSITITLMNDPTSTIAPFEINQTFVLDPNLGEQRVAQGIFWELSDEQKALIPKDAFNNFAIISQDTGLVATDKVQFKLHLEMQLNELEETRQDVINAFQAQDLELTLDYKTKDALGNELIIPIKITSSDTDLQTMNLVNNLVGPKKPISNLLAVLDVTSTKDYEQFNIEVGDKFLDLTDTTTTMVEIKEPLDNVLESLDLKLYNDSYESDGEVFGLNNKLALLGNEITNIDNKTSKLNEALDITENNYKLAKMEFQSTATALQNDINEKRNIYLGYYETKKQLISQKEILTQKLNAVEVKLNELRTKRNSLQDTMASTIDNNVELSDLIAQTDATIVTLNNELTVINSEIDVLINSINGLATAIQNKINQLTTLAQFVINYKSSYYRITSMSAGTYDLTDYTLIAPRLANTLNRINELTIQKEALEIRLEVAEKEYRDSLDAYTTDLINGVLTFAQQLIRLQEVKNFENTYNDIVNSLSFVNTERNSQIVVRDGLYPLFSKTKNSIGGELFAEIAGNADPRSTWATMNLVTFTAKIEKVLTEPISFEFVYKQDTMDKAIITIPAGQLENSFSVYLDQFPNTYIDNGMPQWIATINNYDILNLNKYNEKLLNDFVALNQIDSTPQHIYTLDTTKYNLNPMNRNATPKPYNELKTIFETIDIIYLNEILREQETLDLFIKKDEKTIKINSITYYENYRTVLQTMLDNGDTTVNSYQVEIDNLNALILYYSSSTDNPLVPEIPGTNISKDVIYELLQAVETSITNNEPFVASSFADYNGSLNNLAIATDEALGQYQATIEEIKNTIVDIQKEKVNVNILFDLYEEKVNILISINNLLKSIRTSGIFNGEWSKISTLPLNSFEYQDGLEHILLEVMDYLALLPYSSFDTASTLDYVCSISGIAYPTDLQSWIFAKSSGKISTRNYPGATSVGIALNNNTLILNIKHNHCGDISEFLNVYGNSSDFISQFKAIYNTNNLTKQKTTIIFATSNLNDKIAKLNYQLKTNPNTETRTINGESVTITTNLTDIEMDTLDLLTSTISNRELLMRLVYSKYYGSKSLFNPAEYLFGDIDSVSSYYDTVGNPELENKIDIFDLSSNVLYINKLESLLAAAGPVLDTETLKDLFYRKNSLNKDLDIIKYILAALPEPLFNYQARQIELTENYTQLLLMNLQRERMIIFDNPDPNVLDNFENPAIVDPAQLILTTAQIDNFNIMAESKQQEIDTLTFNIDAKELSHNELVQDIKRYVKYKFLYHSIKFTIEKVLEATSEIKLSYDIIKNYFDQRLIELDKSFLNYYKKTDKLPNTMWDIFRITNAQRTKWNYTYLVLRIKGMQQELNDIIVSNTVQYSPINAELNELKIKKNAALTDNSETLAFVYQTEIDSLIVKKNNFQAILDNYVEEFNTIQRAYGYQVINSSLALSDNYIIPELYMQDPTEYDLSYEFAPYPAYKEILA